MSFILCGMAILFIVFVVIPIVCCILIWNEYNRKQQVQKDILAELKKSNSKNIK